MTSIKGLVFAISDHHSFSINFLRALKQSKTQFIKMNKLMFLVLFAMVYLSMAATTVKPGKEKPIKNSTLAPSTSTVKPNRGKLFLMLL